MSTKRSTKATAVADEELFDPVADLQRQVDASTREGSDTPAAPVAPAVESQLNSRLVEAIEKLADAQTTGPIKQIPISKAIIRTPWNPSGSRLRPKLSRHTFMNGFRMHEQTMKNDAIRLFNQLKPGKYNKGRWVVIAADEQEGTTINLYVQNKSFADRIQLKSDARNLVELLTKIVQEQGDEPNVKGD